MARWAVPECVEQIPIARRGPRKNPEFEVVGRPFQCAQEGILLWILAQTLVFRGLYGSKRESQEQGYFLEKRLNIPAATNARFKISNRFAVCAK
jgi:hypothetical protein